MARKDLPYLPLYVQDFLTDEKLMECSASATGVYVRVMCVLHKCNPYGKLLLRQKDRQSEQQILNFAAKLAKHLPFTLQVILDGLNELIEEDVLQIEGDILSQKRMVSDGELSIVRSKSGKLGAKKTNNMNIKFAENFAAANSSANTENEIDINNSIYSIVKNSANGSKNKIINFKAQPEELLAERYRRNEKAALANRKSNN